MAFQSILCPSTNPQLQVPLPGICIWHIFWHSFWHSICYIFGDSLRLRSGGEHSAPELTVEVPPETLSSGACGGGPAGNTLILSLRWRSGGEHSDLELAVEVRRATLWCRGCLLLGSGGEHCDLELAVEVKRGGEGGRRKEGGRQADIKSNNPHLTGGEKNTKQIVEWKTGFYPIEWL